MNAAFEKITRMIDAHVRLHGATGEQVAYDYRLVAAAVPDVAPAVARWIEDRADQSPYAEAFGILAN